MLFGQEKICNHFNQSYPYVKLIMLSSLPYPLFGNLQFFFGLNYLYNILLVIHILCYKTSNLELSYIVRTNYKAHYF